MSERVDLSRSRRDEIVGLAELVAEGDVPVDVDGLLRSQADVSVAYGSFGDAYDGLIEPHGGRFWVYCNLDRTEHPDSPRSRFTLAHEAGHYFIDEHRNALLNGWSSPHPSFTDYTSNELVEREADLFASHLLMPTGPFRSRLKKVDRKAGRGAPAILALAEAFGTSVTSTAIRYIGLTETFCAVVKWTPDGFGWRWVSDDAWTGRYRQTTKDIAALPPDAATSLVVRGERAAAGYVQRGAVASMWFDLVRAGGDRDALLIEQAVPLGRHGVLTVLTAADS